jgi:hypothetical protein
MLFEGKHSVQSVQGKESAMSDDNKQVREPSLITDAAAARSKETHPGEDVEPAPPSAVPEDENIVPNRHSASAEAAALRWREQHEEG